MGVAGLGAAPAPGPDIFSIKVRGLVKAMTLDEKANFITGTFDPDYKGQSGYAPGVPRLKVPGMRWTNGPTGVEVQAAATAVPIGLALAATFDDEAAWRFGVLTGLEARALGQDVVNGPQVDIARLPNWGRNSTALGEDPLLAGRLGAAQVRGIQAQGALATTKHFLGFNQGVNVRGPDAHDFVIDQRTLHELYLPPFEAAARAGSASFMAAYSKVNGAFNSENQANLTGPCATRSAGAASWCRTGMAPSAQGRS
jgi:beta-glucosidase